MIIFSLVFYLDFNLKLPLLPLTDSTILVARTVFKPCLQVSRGTESVKEDVREEDGWGIRTDVLKGEGVVNFIMIRRLA